MSWVSASVKVCAVAALVVTIFQVTSFADSKEELTLPAVQLLPRNSISPNSPSLDGIPLAKADAAFVSQPSSPNAWGGMRTGTESTLSDRVVNYEIQATLDPIKHTVEGREQLTWRNRSDTEVRSVYVHLYLNAFEGNYSTFYTEKRTLGLGFRSNVETKKGEWGHIELTHVAQNGTEVPWTFVHPDNGSENDHTVVRFDLPTPVPPGGSTTLDINFFDQLPRVVARTGYFGTFHLVGQWFPKIAVLELPGERGATEPRWNAHEFHLHSEFYADFGNFDVKLTVPKGFTVGATGEEQGVPIESNGMITHRFVQGDVHDFAWTADNRTAKPLDGVYVGEGSPSVKVRVLYPPEYVASAAPALKTTIASLEYFSKTLGAYPYKTVTVVIPPYNAGEAGAMEYPTFFTAEGYDEVKPDTMAAFKLDIVTIHEFGHGYFYGILASNEFEEPMLDEGLNEYWDFRMLRDLGLVAHWTTPFLKALGVDPIARPFEATRMFASNMDPIDGIGANSWQRLSSKSYGTVYSRSATILRDLEEQLGRPVMARAFKHYYATWKFRHPSIGDFQAAIAEVSGKPDVVAKAFAEQVYSAQKLDDRVEKISSEEILPEQQTALVNGKWVEVSYKQIRKIIEQKRNDWEKKNPEAKEGTGPFEYRTTVTLRRRGIAAPETLVVKFADGSSETVVWNDDKRWARYTWVKPVKAVSAEIDPLESHYLNANMLGNSRLVTPNDVATRRWTSEWETLIQFIISWVATI